MTREASAKELLVAIIGALLTKTVQRNNTLGCVGQLADFEVDSFQHVAHEGVSFVVVGACYNAVVNVRCHKDSVNILVLSAPHSTLVSCLLETLAL
jgi:hypothetical protein